MKPIVVIFILFLSVSNAQYTVNFEKHPINPIPKSYLLEHFKLSGPVKFYYSGYTLYEFDKSGKLLKSSSSMLEDKFFYDSKGHLKQFTGKTSGYDTVITYNFIVDEDGKVLGYKSTSGSSGYTYVFDKKGHYIKKYDSKNQLWNEYQYDSNGRITTKIMHFPSSNYYTTSAYSYEKNGDFLKVTTNYSSTKAGAKSSTYSSHYLNGRYIGKSTNGRNTFDKYNNPTHFLNADGVKSTALGYVYHDGYKSGTDITDKINQYALSDSGQRSSSSLTPSTPSNPSTPSTPSNPSVVQKPETSTPKYGCVNGNCQNGFGKWVYDNGYYDGFWKNGKKEGYGIYIWNSKTKYQGQWLNDQMTGIGEITFPNQDNKMFSGEFKNGKRNGKAIMRIKDNDKWKWTYGIYNNGNLVTEHKFYTNQGITTGCIAGDCQNKYGRYKWANGDTYTGFWENGKMKQGTYRFANDDKYVGEFNSSAQYHGFGRFYFADGSFYHGDWVNGKYHGRGYRYKKQENKVESGEWSYGSFVKDLWKL